MLPILDNIFDAMNSQDASDAYLTVKQPPLLRVNDDVVPMPLSALSTDNMRYILQALLNEQQYKSFERTGEMNCSIGVSGVGRFRINAFYQRQTPMVVIRRIIMQIPEMDALGLPDFVKDLVMLKRGLVLVVGMTGAGKSTTLASMIQHRSREKSGHIITIEDPIEYLHSHQKSLISQREIGIDTENYHIALKNAFRQKPDVIMIGEIRDTYVMEQALSASESGHLCLATLHANNAYQAIERVLNFFEESKQRQARLNLSMNLRAIIAQRLVPNQQGGRSLALEVMLNEGLIRELIAKGETSRIYDVMGENSITGMCTFDQSLLNLSREGKISEETAVAESDRPVDLKLKLRQNGNGGSGKEDKSSHKIDTSGFRI